MSERRSRQPKLPFKEVVVTTGLESGRTRLGTRRTRSQSPSTDFERQQRVSVWWGQEARTAFLAALRAWGVSQSNIVEEGKTGGYSESFDSDGIDQAQTEEKLRIALRNAQKVHITPYEIAQRVKNESKDLKNRGVPEARILTMYFPVFIDTLREVYKKMGIRQKAELTAFLQYQGSLPNI